jgi:hypothetical protein
VNRRRLVLLGRWLSAAAVFALAVWLTWELVRAHPYTGPHTLLPWPGVGFDPNVPCDREYGYFGYLRSRDYYTDYFHGRQVAEERLEWRDRQPACTIATVALVWLVAGRAVSRLTRHPQPRQRTSNAAPDCQ